MRPTILPKWVTCDANQKKGQTSESGDIQHPEFGMNQNSDKSLGEYSIPHKTSSRSRSPAERNRYTSKAEPKKDSTDHLLKSVHNEAGPNRGHTYQRIFCYVRVLWLT